MFSRSELVSIRDCLEAYSLDCELQWKQMLLDYKWSVLLGCDSDDKFEEVVYHRRLAERAFEVYDMVSSRLESDESDDIILDDLPY